jgi:hypothetical protein
MKKKYFYITLLMFFFITLGASAQENKGTAANGGGSQAIEGLNIYPNPVSADRIYITSKNMHSKDVEVYDVLGKKILQASITGKELNIASLTPGVYIIKIKEGEASATRKLIVK